MDFSQNLHVNTGLSSLVSQITPAFGCLLLYRWINNLQNMVQHVSVSKVGQLSELALWGLVSYREQ